MGSFYHRLFRLIITNYWLVNKFWHSCFGMSKRKRPGLIKGKCNKTKIKFTELLTLFYRTPSNMKCITRTTISVQNREGGSSSSKVVLNRFFLNFRRELRCLSWVWETGRGKRCLTRSKPSWSSLSTLAWRVVWDEGGVLGMCHTRSGTSSTASAGKASERAVHNSLIQNERLKSSAKELVNP